MELTKQSVVFPMDYSFGKSICAAGHLRTGKHPSFASTFGAVRFLGKGNRGVQADVWGNWSLWAGQWWCYRSREKWLWTRVSPLPIELQPIFLRVKRKP